MSCPAVVLEGAHTAEQVLFYSSLSHWEGQPMTRHGGAWHFHLSLSPSSSSRKHILFYYFKIDGQRYIDTETPIITTENGVQFNCITIECSCQEDAKRALGRKRTRELTEIEEISLNDEHPIRQEESSEERTEEKDLDEEKEKEKEKEKEVEKEKEGESIGKRESVETLHVPSFFQKKTHSLAVKKRESGNMGGRESSGSGPIAIRKPSKEGETEDGDGDADGEGTFRSSSYRSISRRLFLNQFLIPGVSDATPLSSPLPSSVSSLRPSNDTTKSLFTRKLLIIMVGLPARGKSYTARKLCRYLNWKGFNSMLFNIDNYRKKMTGFQSHEFFSADNAEAMKMREECAQRAVKDAVEFLVDGGLVAVIDGQNSTRQRRRDLWYSAKEYTGKRFSLKFLFLEIVINDKAIIEENISREVGSPDCGPLDRQYLLDDYLKRIAHYEETYEPLCTSADSNHSFIKIIDVGRQIITNRINGYLLSKVLYYLNNLHSLPRPIYLCRHGESEYNTVERVGGDSALTEKGRRFADRLGRFFREEVPLSTLCLWSSTMRRAVESADPIKDECAQYVKWKILDEIDVGICDGLTYEEIETNFKEEFELRSKDKLRYRYPRGESYEDVVRRVEPVIMELERSRRPVLVICHRAVLRCLYAYLTDVPQEEMPVIDVPLHTVYKITNHAYGTRVEKMELNMDPGECVDLVKKRQVLTLKTDFPFPKSPSIHP